MPFLIVGHLMSSSITLVSFGKINLIARLAWCSPSGALEGIRISLANPSFVEVLQEAILLDLLGVPLAIVEGIINSSLEDSFTFKVLPISLQPMVVDTG